MKILLVLDNGKVGGAEKQTINFAEKISDCGHDVSILIIGKGKDSLELITKKEISLLFAIRRHKLDLLSYLKKIIFLLKENKPQVIIATSLFNYSFVAFASVLCGLKAPIVLIFRTFSPFCFRDRIFEIIYSIILHIFKGSWGVVYPGQEKNLFERFLLSKRDTVLIRDGIDTSFYAKEKYLSQNPGIKKPEIFTIAHVASLKPIKDQVTLFKGLKIFNDKTGAKWQLLVAGKGSDAIMKEYKKILEELHITDNVKFLGLLKDVRSTLFLSDIFVLSSWTETLPISAMEAMAMGLPCILPDVGGCSFLVKNGYNGYLMKPKDPAQLAELISNIYLNRNNLMALSVNARNCAVEMFDIKNSIDDFLAFCRSKGIK